MKIPSLEQLTTPRKIEYKHSAKDVKINSMLDDIDYLEYNNMTLIKLLIGISIISIFLTIPAAIGIVKLFGG